MVYDLTTVINGLELVTTDHEISTFNTVVESRFMANMAADPLPT